MRYAELSLVESKTRPIFYHLTTPANAASIREHGFWSSKDGELGPGVYLIDDPQYLTAPRFQGLSKLTVQVATRLLPVKLGTNRILSILRALYGIKRGAAFYDAHRRQLWLDGTPNWMMLRDLTEQAGYGGYTLVGDTGMEKNTLVFDPASITLV